MSLVQPPKDGYLIKSGSVSNASVMDVTGIANFRHYMLVLDSVLPVTDGDGLLMRTSADGGSTFASAASSYLWAKNNVTTAPANTPTGSTGDTEIKLTGAVDNALSNGVSGSIFFYNPASSGLRAPISWQLSCHDAAAVWQSIRGDAERAAAGIVNAVRFLFSTGNIASGNYALYGWR